MHAVLGTELRDRQLAPDRLECYFRLEFSAITLACRLGHLYSSFPKDEPSLSYCPIRGDLLCHEAVACILTEAVDEVIVQANAPRRAGCQLLTGDDTLVDPAMQSRRCDAECHGGLLDRDQFSV